MGTNSKQDIYLESEISWTDYISEERQRDIIDALRWWDLNKLSDSLSIRYAFQSSNLYKNYGAQDNSLKREFIGTNQKLKQNNDLSYTIWRNKGRELNCLGCDYLPKAHRLLINAGSVKYNSGYEANQNRISIFV